MENVILKIEWDQSNTFDFVSDDGSVSIWFVGGIFGIFLFFFQSNFFCCGFYLCRARITKQKVDRNTWAQKKKIK